MRRILELNNSIGGAVFSCERLAESQSVWGKVRSELGYKCSYSRTPACALTDS